MSLGNGIRGRHGPGFLLFALCVCVYVCVCVCLLVLVVLLLLAAEEAGKNM